MKKQKGFFCNITHELKNPLTSISGYAELLQTNYDFDNKKVTKFDEKYEGRCVAIDGMDFKNKFFTYNSSKIGEEGKIIVKYGIIEENKLVIKGNLYKNNEDLAPSNS